jgi:hypothetical protein
MYEYISNNKHLYPFLTGLTYEQFEILLNKFSKQLRIAERHKYMPETNRIRSFGGGRKSKLDSDAKKLLFILFFYRIYPTFRLAEAIFGMDHTNCARWKDFLEPVLNKALGYQLNMPPMHMRLKSLDKFIEICPQMIECIVDATERPIRRPKDNINEVRYFSGKRKCHTVKNQIVINPRSKKILHVSKTYEGRKHDKKVFEEEEWLWLRAPPGTEILGDSGYLGIDQLSPHIKLIRPFKKPLGGKLTNAQKDTNKQLSSLRVRVEHPFAHMKNFNILKHRFRNRLDKAHMPFETIACICNFKLDST